MLRVLAVCLALCLVSSSARAAENPVGGAAQLHAKALEAMQAQRYGEAAELFHAAYELDSAPELLWNEARARHMAGELERARDLYKQFIERDDAPSSLRGRASDSILEITRELEKPKLVDPPTTPVARDDTFGTVMVVAGGALVVGGVIAHVFAFDAASEMDTYSKEGAEGLDIDERKRRYDDASDAKDTALALAWVGYGVGAAALITGVVSLVITDDPEVGVNDSAIQIEPVWLRGGAGFGATLKF